MQEHKHIYVGVVVVALIIVGMFVFAYLKKQELASPTLVVQPETPAADVAYPNITTITAKHFFIDSVHTLVGEIPFPTPCDLLSWETRVQESLPETAIVDFTVVNHAESCAQVVTSQRFKASFSASEDANIKATFMGRSIPLNLIPANPGETPDEYELFIKG